MRSAWSGFHRGKPNPVTTGRKCCARCGRWRPVSDFSLRGGSCSRLKSWCQTCHRISGREVHARLTPERRKLRQEYQRIYLEAKRHEAGIPVHPLREEPPREPKKRRAPQLPTEPLVEAMISYRLAQRANGHPDYGWEILADAAGTTERSINRMTRGESHHVSLELADRIAVAMGIPLALIYPYEETTA